MTFRKKIILFLGDVVSFIVYLLIFFRERKGSVALVYHSVREIDHKDDPYRINVFPHNFEKHLKVISQYKDKIVVTFDDGYSNNFDNAFPLLKKYNLSATVFLATDFVDGKIKSEDFGGKNFNERPLTWDEVKIMDRAGIKFGSHSKTHPFLSKLSESELKVELIDSRKRIEEILGHGIDSFAYPFGDVDSFDDLTKKALMESKYNHAYTNIMGSNSSNPNDKFALRRIRIHSEDGPLKLKMKIKGAYDWVGFVRSAIKTMRREAISKD